MKIFKCLLVILAMTTVSCNIERDIPEDYKSTRDKYISFSISTQDHENETYDYIINTIDFYFFYNETPVGHIVQENAVDDIYRVWLKNLKQIPDKVVIITNNDKNFGINDQIKLSDFLNQTTGGVHYEGNNICSNATYYEDDKIIRYTPIYIENIYDKNKEKEKDKKPVVIHLERLKAKIKYTPEDSDGDGIPIKFISSAQGEKKEETDKFSIITDVKEGNKIIRKDATARFKKTKWWVYNEPQKTYIVKNISKYEKSWKLKDKPYMISWAETPKEFFNDYKTKAYEQGCEKDIFCYESTFDTKKPKLVIAGKLVLDIQDKDTREINGEEDEQYIIRRYNDLYTKDAFIESIKNDETIKRYYVLKKGAKLTESDSIRNTGLDNSFFIFTDPNKFRPLEYEDDYTIKYKKGKDENSNKRYTYICLNKSLIVEDLYTIAWKGHDKHEDSYKHATDDILINLEEVFGKNNDKKSISKYGRSFIQMKHEVQIWKNMLTYYSADIKHNDKNGVVRNHEYEIKIKKIINLGNGIPEENMPVIPEEYGDKDKYINIEITPLNWAPKIENPVDLDPDSK